MKYLGFFEGVRQFPLLPQPRCTAMQPNLQIFYGDKIAKLWRI